MTNGKSLRKSHLWSGLTGVGALLLGVVLAGTTIAWEQKGEINNLFGLNSKNTFSGTEFTEDGSLTNDGFYNYIEAAYDYCEQEEEEGSVLLHNVNNALPLASSERNVTVFGRGSVDPVFRSTAGGSSSNKEYEKTVVTALTDAGFKVNPSVLDAYDGATPESRSVSSVGEYDPAVYTEAVKNSFSNYGDVAIITLSRFATEGQDLATVNDKGNRMLELDPNEKAMLEVVKNGGFKKRILLLNSVFAMELDWLDDYDIDGVLWIGNPGFYGMPGAVRVLTGEVNPSGHLQATYASNSLSAPSAMNFGLYDFNYDGKTPRYLGQGYVTYAEGIYVGYKYYETRYADCLLNQGNANSTAGTYNSDGNWNYADEICYPFGYGMSYTTFDYNLDNLTYDQGKDQFTATVTVENTGTVDGKASVQLYASLPYTDFDKQNGIEKSAIQLVDFDKVDVEAGKSVTTTITFDRYLISTYDSKVNKGYIFEPGDYYFAVGNGAHEALNNILAFQGVNGLYDQDGNSVTGDTGCARKWTATNTSLDSDTYKNSPYNTSVQVTNKFDHADINNWVNDDEKITYLSRNDWAGTYPETVTTLTVNDRMYDGLDMQFYEKPADAPSLDDLDFEVELEEKINFLDMKGVDFDDPKWDDFLSQLSLHDLLTNMGDSKGIQAIVSVNKPSCAIVDGPEGMNGQFKFGDRRNCTGWATPTIVAASWDKDIMRRYGEMYGEDALYASIPIAYAPGSDILRSPYSGRTSEYYSEDGMLAYWASTNVINGMRSKGLIGTMKHMFLNEQETYRQGIATFANEQSIREIYLKPFEGALTIGEGLGVMTSYNRIGLTYAAADTSIQYVLRDEWNYGGYIIDDALSASEYSSAPEMLCAGTNVFCLDTARPVELEELITSTDDGYLAQKVIDSNHYIYYIMLQSSMAGISGDVVVTDGLEGWQIAIVAADVVIGLLAAGALVMFVLNTYVWKNKKAEGDNQ